MHTRSEGLKATNYLELLMNRRTFLAGGVATGTSLALAGCLDRVTGLIDDSPTVLDEPDMYDEMRQSRDDGYLGFPIHNDELPAVTLPDALSDREVTTTEFVGEKHSLMTFIFTRCPEACPVVVSNLARVQLDAVEEGYDDEMAFMPVTFDPEYDTPDVLEEFSEANGADPGADNWHFLRPEDEQRADEVVNGTFGADYEYHSEEEREQEGMPDDMAYSHLYLILLTNKDGYVERGYNGSRLPNASGLVQDVREVVEGW